MTIRTFILAVLATTTVAGTAAADERTFLTPPLYREQARITATVRPASELATVPSVTPGAGPAPRIVAAAVEVPAR